MSSASQYRRPAVYGLPTGPCTVAALLAGKPAPPLGQQPHPRPDRSVPAATLRPGTGGSLPGVANQSRCGAA